MMGNNSINSGYNSSYPYNISIPTNSNQMKYIPSTNTSVVMNYPTIAPLHGYMKPISA